MSFETIRRTPTIEEQFDHPQTIKTEGGAIEIIDVTPEEQKTEVPTVIAPGWSATPEIFREIILGLAANKRRVISANAIHGIPLEKNTEGTKKMPEAELRKVAALIKMLEEKGIEKVDAVGHSEAGIYLAIAATLYPEKFRNIVLVNPAGIIGKDTLFKGLAPRFIYEVLLRQPLRTLRGEKKVTISEEKDERSGKIQWIAKTTNRHVRIPGIIGKTLIAGQSLGKTLTGPIKTAEEIAAIANADIRDMLKCLKEQGIGISIVHAVDDSVFPMERVQKSIGTEHIDGFYAVKGTHNAPYLNPKKFTPLIDRALDALEERTIKR